MRKVAFAVTVLALVKVLGCAARTGQEPQAGETQATAEQALGRCSNQEVDVVPAPDGGMQFAPLPPWTICKGKKLIIENELDAGICVDLTRTSNNTVILRKAVAPDDEVRQKLEHKGEFELDVCPQTDTCERQGCPDAGVSAESRGPRPDTIKGNLTVTSGGSTED